MDPPARPRRHRQARGSPRCLLILNAKSRSGAEASAGILTALRERGAELVGGAPVEPGEVDARLPRVTPDGIDLALIGGGDGTLNGALPYLLRIGIPLGVLPLGTANDFATSLGIPAEPNAAIDVALFGRAMDVDIGRVNGKPYLNVASLGLGVKVTETLSGELKARLGFFGYPRAVLRAYREARPFGARVRVDAGREQRIRCIHLAVGNSRRYGGGAIIAQDARLVDARLHLLALKPMPLWRLLVLSPWVSSGRYRGLREVASLNGARFEIETSRPLLISADGEILGRTPATFEVMSRALRVMVPREGPEEEPALVDA
jgi:diacylglycerol kinase (ATP)